MKPVIINNKVLREFSYKTYKCEVCNILFRHRINYEIHLDENHKSKNGFRCC